MSQNATADTRHTASDEDKLRARIEELTGGKMIAIERQIRWRPAWFADVEKDGEILHIHVRGDRESDVLPFPDLKREADILATLEKHGIPAPHIYGMCDDPNAIIMEAVPGSRDVSTAANDEERRSVARQYIDALAAMHQLPIDDFAAIGIRVPKNAREIALVGLDAYLPLYEKHKCRPEPFIEFAVQWLKSNIPEHRTRPSFIAFDAGQFMFKDGKIKALYDFEFAMIGDPLNDLATMAMRHSYEPTGDEIGNLCRYYEEVTGEPLDIKVIRYHHALFSTVSCMQMVGPTSNPQPGDPHDVYTEWDIALRRSLRNVLEENLGVKLEKPAPLPERPGKNATLYTMLNDAVDNISTGDEVQAAQKFAARRLVEYMTRVDQYGDEINRLAAVEAEPLLGEYIEDKAERDARMEAFVRTAGSEHHPALLQYFTNEIERQVQVYGSTAIGESASHVRLEPIE